MSQLNNSSPENGTFRSAWGREYNPWEPKTTKKP